MDKDAASPPHYYSVAAPEKAGPPPPPVVLVAQPANVEAQIGYDYQLQREWSPGSDSARGDVDGWLTAGYV